MKPHHEFFAKFFSSINSYKTEDMLEGINLPQGSSIASMSINIDVQPAVSETSYLLIIAPFDPLSTIEAYLFKYPVSSFVLGAKFFILSSISA